MQKRRSLPGLGLIIFLLLIAFLGVRVINGITRPRPSRPKVPVRISERQTSRALQSWRDFVAEARANCAKESNARLYFEAYHEYDGQSFGVIASGYQDSEYATDLFRLDAKTKRWVSSPTRESAYFAEVDVQATSRQWGIPQETIERWLKEAQEAVYARSKPK
jgi:hypothetical protein